MPAWGPVSHRVLVRSFRALCFDSPFSSGRHLFMVHGDLVFTVPNPHGADISVGLLARLLRQAGVDRKQWEEVE